MVIAGIQILRQTFAHDQITKNRAFNYLVTNDDEKYMISMYFGNTLSAIKTQLFS
jgi:hypothetical protein